jgi:hypothetical protein
MGANPLARAGRQSVEGKIWLHMQPVLLECFDQPRFVALPFGQPPAENRVNVVLSHKWSEYAMP